MTAYGRALDFGYKTYVLTTLYTSKTILGIELIVALPFEGHDSKWDAMSKQRLQIIIHNATKCIVIGQSGTTSDYKKRNYYMVDHADFLLAVYDNNRKLRSGTGQTVNYALKQNLRIIFLHPDTAEIS